MHKIYSLILALFVWASPLIAYYPQACDPYCYGPQPCDACCYPQPCDPFSLPPCRLPCSLRFHGFYLGAHIGWALHDRVWVDRDAWVDNFTDDWALGSIYTTNDGIMGGIQGGYNLQCNQALFGLELDMSWADLHRQKIMSPVGFPGTELTLRDKMNWFGTIRGRTGIVASDLLLYVTAGAAYAYVKQHWSIADPLVAGESFSENRIRWGLALGSGAEWACTSYISLKAEGMFFKFPERTKRGFSPSGAADVDFDLINSVWMFKLGFNFRVCALWSCCPW